MKQSKRILSFGLTAVLAFSSVIPASGAPSNPPCDETLYVTLDPYGEITESSVVKSYLLDGRTQIIDYGTYDKVINMTDYADPQIGEDGSVTFNLEQPEERFYFEGKTQVTRQQLPWNIDVSYRLNGVDKKAEELAGATGLVEINIDLLPNKQVSDYYKNNLVLSAAAIVDMDKNLSLEAEGAQVQTMGNMNAVVYFALPGEEQHYTIKIGSNDFKFSGLVFLIVPATLGQLDRVNDLRSAKETIEDSSEAISNSLDVVLNTLGGMQKSIGDTADGLHNLDQSRQLIADSKGKVYENADAALAALNELSADLKPFSAHTKEASNALDRINSNLNEMVATLDDLSPQLGDLRDNIRALRDDVDTIKGLLNSPEVNMATQQFAALLARTQSDLDALKTAQQTLNSGLAGLGQAMTQLGGGLGTLKSYSGFMSESFDEDTINNLVEQLQDEGFDNSEDIANYLSEYSDFAPGEIDQLIETLSDALGMDENISKSARVASGSNAIPPALLTPLGNLIAGTAGSVGNTNLTDDLSGMITLTGNMLQLLNTQKGVLNGSLESIKDLGTTAGKICDTADDLISSVDDLNRTVNTYHGEAIDTLRDAGILVETAGKGIDSLYIFFSSLENQTKSVGDSLNTGTQKTLNGLAGALEQAQSGLAQTDTVQNAKDTIKQLIDDKWDEYTGEDMNILNFDSEAPPVSFTSEKNPAPRTIQMVLRTQEIKADDAKQSVDVDEDFHPDGTIFHRIGNIFKKIWEAITSFFH